ncbi:alpha/beta fold hydrolase [Actinomycetospora straminea]|uniref:Alpha/beta fold hydrolase n=1 Tax=Actinomycetospora straminea TaxID=663607 RepID=A0ABP9DX66_9PSEU|nr:alpha/beta fold hydrolase [Actinomycetospora straminea]MDD7936258.1 alpha/beta fold hydrolase [Actinomycetospora straminea]
MIGAVMGALRPTRSPDTLTVPGHPSTPRSVEIGGHRMAYVDEGSGPPVLLVHGNPTWSFYWRSLLAALPAAGMRAIAPDHIGMGRSARPGADEYPHTLRRRVDDLGAFVDALGLDEPISLVVHDWGGPIALSWAAENVERLDKLVLLNTAAFPLPAGHRIPWTLQVARLPVVGDVAVRGLGAFSRGALVLGTARRWLPAEARRGLLAPYDSPAHRTAVHAFVQDIPTDPGDPAHPVLERLARRLPLLDDLPVQVWWGMQDPVFDGRILAELEARLPRAEVHRLADAGHYVLEDAADRIVPGVRDFLAGPG